MNYTTGDSAVPSLKEREVKRAPGGARITSEKEVTVDFVVAEADAIWKKARAKKITFGDLDAANALMAEIQREHPEFCKSYPIVNRYICQMGEYKSKAFRLWLNKIKLHPWTSEAAYLDAQADYVAMLFRVKHPRAALREVNNVRNTVRAMLETEHRTFKTRAEQIEKEVTTTEEQLLAKSRRELAEYLREVTSEVTSTTAIDTSETPQENTDGSASTEVVTEAISTIRSSAVSEHVDLGAASLLM
jgi:hypothetical protein